MNMIFRRLSLICAIHNKFNTEIQSSQFSDQLKQNIDDEMKNIYESIQLCQEFQKAMFLEKETLYKQYQDEFRVMLQSQNSYLQFLQNINFRLPTSGYASSQKFRKVSRSEKNYKFIEGLCQEVKSGAFSYIEQLLISGRSS